MHVLPGDFISDSSTTLESKKASCLKHPAPLRASTISALNLRKTQNLKKTLKIRQITIKQLSGPPPLDNRLPRLFIMLEFLPPNRYA